MFLTTTGWILLIVGALIVFYAATKFFLPTPISFGARGVLSIVGIILIVGAFLFVPAQQLPSQQIAVNAPTVSVENFAHFTGATLVSASSNTLQVDAKVNVTTSTPTWVNGAPASGVAKFSFDLMRTDSGVNAAVFTVSLVSNPIVDNTTAANDANIISTPTTNNTPQIFFQTPQISSPGASSSTTVSVPAAGLSQVNVTIDLSAQAVANMKEYSTQVIELNAGGNNIFVDVVLTGYAPA
jgi:hypothetical protein